MPDFAAEGNLALKPWFGSDEGLDLPEELRLPVVEALAPYNEQVALLNTQIGGVVPRQTHEGRLGRLADGPQDAGQQPARHHAC